MWLVVHSVTDTADTALIEIVLSKLKEITRESVRDKQFEKFNDLVLHVKKYFAPINKEH